MEPVRNKTGSSTFNDDVRATTFAPRRVFGQERRPEGGTSARRPFKGPKILLRQRPNRSTGFSRWFPIPPFWTRSMVAQNPLAPATPKKVSALSL